MRKFILPCLILSFTLSSCSDLELNPNNQISNISQNGNSELFQLSKKITVNDERLVFENFDVFDETINTLQKVNEKERDNWFLNFQFLSLKDVYAEEFGGNPLNNPKFLSDHNLPFLFDDIMIRILNSNGIFQIGEDVIKIGFEKGFSQNLSEYNKNDVDRNKREFEVKVNFLVEDKNKNLRDFWPGNYNHDWDHSTAGSIKLHAWNEMLGFYIGFGVSSSTSSSVDKIELSANTQYEKKGLFGHGWRSLSYNQMLLSSNYLGGTLKSSATVPQLFQFYVVKMSIANSITQNGTKESRYYNL